jgi:hypothetical protein
VSAAEQDNRGRIEALERVNAELAAEIRNLVIGRISAPRSGLLGSSRRIATAAALSEERDSALDRLERANTEIGQLRQRNDELRELIERQVAELERLRAGPLGVVRRLKASWLRRWSRSSKRDGDA